jgi:hypothetical protein
VVSARLLAAALLCAGCAQKKAAAPTPDAAAAPRDLFAGCRGEREHGTTAIECGEGLMLTVVRSQVEGAGDPALLRQALEASRGVLEAEGVTIAERAERAMPGAGVAEAFRYAVPEDDERGRGLLAVARGRPQAVVTVLCIDSRDAGACAPMTEEVLARGVPARLLPDAAPAAPPEVRFAGHAIPLPAGCTSTGGEDIVCGAASLVWTRVSEDTLANAGDTFFDGLMGAAGGMPKPDFSAEAPCSVDGVAASCRRRVWTREQTLGVALSAAARVRGEPLALVCFWTVDGAGARDGLPEACRLLLELR